MFKRMTAAGWCYLSYGLLTCGYFYTAATGGWRFPDILSAFDEGGSSYGRSSGGSWGGGK